jgi:hypothetical protein
MKPVMKSVLKSYIRGAIVAITPLLATNQTDPWMYAIAIVAGVISPALRALDKQDPAFGMIADVIDAETNKLLKATKKKVAKKKVKK